MSEACLYGPSTVGGISANTTEEDEFMAKHGKKYLEAAKLIDSEATYEPLEAVELVKKAATAKFD